MTSMIYTVGMALNRAADNGFSVSILIGGQWIDGQVAANDGTGVVIETDDGAHLVVRSEAISAVKVLAQSPHRAEISECRATPMHDSEARPMPGPRVAHAS